MNQGATVVLVHGAWHGAWCWDRVLDALHPSVAHRTLDLPLTTLDDDIAAVRDVLDTVDGEVVLCGHSYGGAVITGAGHHPAVRELVYLAAFALDEDESLGSAMPDAGAPYRDLSGVLDVRADGTVMVVPELAAGVFYNDCDPADAAAATSRLRPMGATIVSAASGPPAWRDKPSTYVVCTEDMAVHPELQRLMAARAGATTIEWSTGHSPFLNRPELVAALLEERA